MQIIRKIFNAFKKRLPGILLINLCMLILLTLLYLLLGGSAFSIYVKEMALNIMSVSDAILYISVLAVYGFTLEFVFRRLIQDRFLNSDKPFVKAMAFILPVVLYVLIHCRYGNTGIIYSTITGVFLTVFYLWKKDWLTFSLWHMTWGFIIIPLSMSACVFLGGQIRQDFLFAYKKRHIVKKKMYYMDNWGWVDYTHYRPDHFKLISDAMNAEDTQGEIAIHDGWVTPLRIRVSFSVKYKFIKQQDPMEQWAQITGILMHFMRKNEEVQETSPWYHGNQLSAWQFDDMSSCLLCCLDHLPDKTYFKRGVETHDSEGLLEIWEKNGEEMVALKMKEEGSWNLLRDSQSRLKLIALVDKMKSTWEAEESPAAAGQH